MKPASAIARRPGLVLSLVALAAYLLTAGGHLYSPDEEIVFRTTRSLVERGSLAIEPLGGFATRRGTDGFEYGQYGVGQSILAIPFYVAGRAMAPLASDATWRRLYGIPADEPPGARGFVPVARELAPRFACSFFNVFVSAAFVGLVFALATELTGDRRAAAFAACLYGFGSLAWAHSRPFFTETAAAYFLVLAWWCVLRGIRSARATSGRRSLAAWCAAGGLAAGFAALVRMDTVLLYPGLALVMLGPVLRAERSLARTNEPSDARPANPNVEGAAASAPGADLQSPHLPSSLFPSSLFPSSIPSSWAAFCAPAILCGAVLLGLNAARFGGLFETGYSDQPEGVNFSTPLLAGLHGFLCTPGKGLFFFSPGLFPALFAWGAARRRDPWLAAGLALSVIVPLLVMSKWPNWAGGWCWGPRHIVMIHPFLALAVAPWLAEGLSPVRRVGCLVALAVGAGVQLLGSSQDFIEFHRRFFREPGRQFLVQYDSFDAGYWAGHYRLAENITDPAGAWTERPLNYAPAPIQHSIYMPQTSVWAGYPVMWREGSFDNVWARASGASPPRAE